ncbi:72_t:CDS:2 [Gigaspora rosea]|nr:72_t:CDS:2 [Gigaspora rosea]
MVETPNERRKRLQRERQQRYRKQKIPTTDSGQEQHLEINNNNAGKRIRVSNNAANILTSSSLSSFVSTIENRPIPSLNPDIVANNEEETIANNIEEAVANNVEEQ